MLSETVERHIALHLVTGYLFRRQSGLLRGFAKWAQAKGDEVVRTTTAVEWAALGPTVSTRYGRLQVVRRFARLVHAEDQRHEIPPAAVFGGRPGRRRTPHIYSPREIQLLLDAASRLGPRRSLRSRAYVTLLGLIAATGMRISEALALRLDDITSAGLVIRESKFRKSRLVPLHPTTRAALDAYLRARAKHADDHAVFVSERRTRMHYSRVITTFLTLVRQIGIHPGPGRPGPRIHDLRHTFAVRSLEQCTGNRDDIARHMLALSTYLGHAHVADTYWYLQATPKLLVEIANRAESLAKRGAR